MDIRDLPENAVIDVVKTQNKYKARVIKHFKWVIQLEVLNKEATHVIYKDCINVKDVCYGLIGVTYKGEVLTLPPIEILYGLQKVEE